MLITESSKGDHFFVFLVLPEKPIKDAAEF